MGFGDNDHMIRELMRFIEMTSRESMFEDVIQNRGAFKFFYILNLSIEKVVL